LQHRENPQCPISGNNAIPGQRAASSKGEQARAPLWVVALLILTIAARPGKAQDDGAPAGPKAYPAAIFPFAERGASVEQYGSRASDILIARLVADPGLVLVDRAELARTLQELELNASGMVKSSATTPDACWGRRCR
jgi:hypothetical protein